MYLVLTLFCILRGRYKAYGNALMFHFEQSIFKDKPWGFWNPHISWRNKYKNGDPAEGAAYPLATTLLVGFTDAWHGFEFKQLFAVGLSIFTVPFIKPSIVETFIIAVSYILLTSLSFEIHYRYAKRAK